MGFPPVAGLSRRTLPRANQLISKTLQFFYAMNRYPPLKSLLFLDAAMRSSSFSLAAEELCVTPGAVGQQIQKLEEWLGTPLFVRQARQVTPTAEGIAYWKRIQPALAQIADASLAVRHRRSRSVCLSMPPSFAACWFTRRMAGFLTSHPDIELHVNSTAALVDFERDAVDLAIRYFDGRDPALDATLLYPDEARVYCRPDYAETLGLARPADLERATLLDTTLHPHWRVWLQRFADIGEARYEAIGRVLFDQGLMAIEAAKQGQGVVMSSPVLVAEEVRHGRLFEPFGLSLPLASGYYVVHHRRLAIRPASLAMKNWLIAESRAGI
jgi:LysR family glycine cleavage system transcriptional activator